MTRILTGITTTGTPHLGNYAGAIRPAILASRDSSRLVLLPGRLPRPDQVR
jgi:tryptophanyl-tRNA synthetase